jgi:hypothetical protein
MIHKEQVKDIKTGEMSTKYTTDLKGHKVVIVDDSPVEVKMDIDERRNRRDGQNIGKFKQRNVTKLQKKNERERDTRMKRDIEDRIGEFVDKVSAEDVDNKLTYTKPKNVLDAINKFLKENEEEDSEDDEIEPNFDPKAFNKLSDEEKKKVEDIKKKILDSGEESDSEEDTDDEPESDSEEDTEDEPESDSEEDTDDEPESDSEEDTEDEPESDSEETPVDEPEDEEKSDSKDDDEAPEDPLEGDNDIAKHVVEMEYNIDQNNAYDFYEFLMNKFTDTGNVSLINSAYMKVGEYKRKLTPARELLDHINSIIIKDEEEPEDPMADMGGGF